MYLAVKLKQHHVNSFGKSLNATDVHKTVPHCRFKKLLIFVMTETIFVWVINLSKLVSLLDFSLSIVLSDSHNTGHKWDLLMLNVSEGIHHFFFTDERQLPLRKKMLASDARNPRLQTGKTISKEICWIYQLAVLFCCCLLTISHNSSLRLITFVWIFWEIVAFTTLSWFFNFLIMKVALLWL